MIKFAILVEQMKTLRLQYDLEKAKVNPNRRVILDLEHRVKLHSKRMDEYGAKSPLKLLHLSVKNIKTRNEHGARMYLAVPEEGTDLFDVVKWKLKGTNFILMSVVSEEHYSLGTILAF